MIKDREPIDIRAAVERLPYGARKRGTVLPEGQMYLSEGKGVPTFIVEGFNLAADPRRFVLGVRRSDVSGPAPMDGCHNYVLGFELQADRKGNVVLFAPNESLDLFHYDTSKDIGLGRSYQYKIFRYRANGSDTAATLFEAVQMEAYANDTRQTGLTVKPDPRLIQLAEERGLPVKCDWLETLRMYVDGKFKDQTGQILSLTARRIMEHPLIPAEGL